MNTDKKEREELGVGGVEGDYALQQVVPVMLADQRGESTMLWTITGREVRYNPM
jgi:hypothetical protein